MIATFKCIQSHRILPAVSWLASNGNNPLIGGTKKLAIPRTHLLTTPSTPAVRSGCPLPL
ncbi:hypothetical protein BJV78DRAFT_1225693 [Lactifluus subvellereus]|nr:hypothetical protein BJV78DRAFT_1225693 [Lactifluus subvellereus]